MDFCRFRKEGGSVIELDYMETYADNAAVQAAWVSIDNTKIQSYLETTDYYQGAKAIKLQTLLSATGEYVEAAPQASPVDISSKNTLKFVTYSKAGFETYGLIPFNFKMYDSVSGLILTRTIFHRMDESSRRLGRWKKWFVDLSDYTSAQLDAINALRITVLSSIVGLIFYVDDIKADLDTIVTITSCSPTLPISNPPEFNQVISESISGVRQAAELGSPRERLTIILPNLSDSDYYNLVYFFKYHVEWGLNEFIYEDLQLDRTWTVYLDSFEPIHKKAKRHSVTLNMIQKASATEIN